MKVTQAEIIVDRMSLDQARAICEQAGLAVVPKQDPEVFRQWLCLEFPEGCLMGDPSWWAKRITRRFIPQAMLEAAKEVKP